MTEASDEQWLPAWFGDAYFTTAPALSARVFKPRGIRLWEALNEFVKSLH